MSGHAPDLELLVHEAVERLHHGFAVDRREFVKLLGGGLLVFAAAPALTQESGRPGRGGFGEQMPRDLAAWLHIGEDGHTTVYTGKVEMGQNIRTSLAQHVAEELRVPVERISLLMGDTDLTPYDAGTFGSRTTPQMGRQLRAVAATARIALVELAAAKFGADPAALIAEDGQVRERGNHRSVSYGELTRGQKIAKQIGDQPPLAPATEWRVAGHPQPKVNGAAFVTGKHQYASDVVRPGMLIGKVLRPAAFGAKLRTLDASAAEKLPGVTVVHDGDFVGVAAPTQHAAEQALAALQADWETTPQPAEAQLFELLRQPGGGEGGGGGRPQVTGNVEQALAAAPHKLEATYTVAYIAHTPLEPRAAVAEWTGDKLTVWTGSQRPWGVRDDLARELHLAPEKVRVIIPDTGSGYGGKHTGECAVEAARLAQAAKHPVKLVWTREEEFTWAYFRPAGVIDVKSAAADDGTLLAWEFHNYNSGGAAIQTPYRVPNQHIEFHPAHSPLRIGSYRGLAATANHFARESHMDELAHALGLDPLAFRLKNIPDARLRDIFSATAERFGWGKEKSTPERGFGLAGGFEKGGYTACCAEVAITADRVRIARVVVGFECGAVVNPDGLRNQVSGAIVQGIGGAMFEAIHFENGRITNPHVGSYRLPRFSDTPAIEVVILDRKDQPSFGAGETPIVGLAPAVANAIFAATGRRLRAMPLVPGGLPA